MNTIGERLQATFFGESHGEVIGIVIRGLPAGMPIDIGRIKLRLEQRRPAALWESARQEPDDFEIASGYRGNLSTGAPLTVLIKNRDVASADYENLKNTPRPSHADYPAHVKYAGHNDPRGGGVFSGRITALTVVLGAICEAFLERSNIEVFSHILSVKDIHDDAFDKSNVNNELAKRLKSSRFPVINPEKAELMTTLIKETKATLDSVGGVVESAILNLPVGLGEPLFGSLESRLSQLLFSIPGVKGIEFGDGFGLTELYGSEANDAYHYDGDRVVATTNHNGGILGGLSTGMPVILRMAIKPTPSIGKPQRTVDLEKRVDTTITVGGRHDPAIIARVVPVVNAVISFGICDLLYQFHESDWIK